MSQSWGHSIIALECIHSINGEASRCTAGRKCREVAFYQTRYNYVTGAKGRVSAQQRPACYQHALAFAKKYGLTMPPLPLLVAHDWLFCAEAKKLQVCRNCNAYREQGEFAWQFESDEDLQFCPPTSRAKTA
jgi:hypothetical protein